MAHLDNMAKFFNLAEAANEGFADYDSMYEAYMEGEFENVWLPMCVTATSVASFGGEEQGSDYWRVIKFVDTGYGGSTIYVKFQGYYASFIGSDYESWEIVVQKEKIITVWE